MTEGQGPLAGLTVEQADRITQMQENYERCIANQKDTINRLLAENRRLKESSND